LNFCWDVVGGAEGDGEEGLEYRGVEAFELSEESFRDGGRHLDDEMRLVTKLV